MDVLDAGCVDRSSCDWFLNDLGPPPDAILRIPPPPVPHFIDSDYVVAARMALTDDPANNDTLCNWCHWARLVDSTSITGSAGTGNSNSITTNLIEFYWIFLSFFFSFETQKWRWKIRGSSWFWLRVWCSRSAPYSPDSFIYDFTGKNSFQRLSALLSLCLSITSTQTGQC